MLALISADYFFESNDWLTAGMILIE
jgi:hypothetical protein